MLLIQVASALENFYSHPCNLVGELVNVMKTKKNAIGTISNEWPRTIARIITIVKNSKNFPRLQPVQKLEAAKMFLLAISETTVELSLFTYRWKALPEQQINTLNISTILCCH